MATKISEEQARQYWRETVLPALRRDISGEETAQVNKSFCSLGVGRVAVMVEPHSEEAIIAKLKVLKHQQAAVIQSPLSEPALAKSESTASKSGLFASVRNMFKTPAESQGKNKFKPK